jgi:hypothetical protein
MLPLRLTAARLEKGVGVAAEPGPGKFVSHVQQCLDITLKSSENLQ